MFANETAVTRAIQARVKHHIDTFGKLPTRQKVLEMAAQQASTLNMDKDTPGFEDQEIVDLSLTDLSSDVAGFKDFPSKKMQDAVEAKAREAIAMGGDFTDAMSLVYGNAEVMLPLYEERLQEMFSLVDTAPKSATQDPRLDAELKIKHLMPGSNFYNYLTRTSSGSKLSGEALDAYHTLLIQGLRDQASSTRIVDIAKSAYACAQKIQASNKGPVKSDPGFKLLAKPFAPELQGLLAKQGDINWVGHLSDAGSKVILDHIKGLNNEPVTGEYANTFIEDAHRSTFIFDLGNDKPLGNEDSDRHKKTEKSKQALSIFVDNHPVAKATLSKVLGQTGIGMMPNVELSKLYHEDWEQNQVYLRSENIDRGPDVRDQILSYTTSTTPGSDKVTVTYDLYLKADSAKSSFETFPVNRDHKLTGDIDLSNYGIHQRASIELDMKDLENGIINPTMADKPMIELHIKPDWGLMAVEKERAAFKEQLSAYSMRESKAFEDLAYAYGYDFDKALEVGKTRVPAWSTLEQLAPGQISIADNQETILSHQFSTNAVAKMNADIEKLSSPSDAVGGSIDPASGLPKQYLEDAARQVNQFVGPDGALREADDKAQAIAMMNRFAGSEAAAKALACLCNQGVIGTVTSQFAADAIPGSKVVPIRDHGKAGWVYRLTRLPNGNVGFNMKLSAALKGVDIFVPNGAGKTIYTQQWPQEQELTDENYDFRSTMHLELDETELQKGNLKIVNSPEYTHTLKLRPDWNLEP